MIHTKAICTKIEMSDSNQVSFVFFRPEQPFEFKEGQFMFLEIPGKTRSNGKPLKNAYSIATTNTLLQNTGEIGFIVKKASEDGVSNYLTQQVKVGDSIEMKGPLGHFVDKKLSKNYLFISIGSGVTPIYSLYDTLINETKEYAKIANIFGERYAADVLPAIQTMFLNHNENIKNFCCLSREENLLQGWSRGYVQDQLQDALAFLDADKDLHIFICGKPAMCDDIVNKLLDQGYEKSQMTVEKY